MKVRDFILAATLIGTNDCQDTRTNHVLSETSVRHRIPTFEGHDHTFFARLNAALIFTDINHEDCALIADALTNNTPGPVLTDLKSLTVLPGTEKANSDAGVSGMEYIRMFEEIGRTPGRFQSCALISDEQLIRLAAIVDEYVASHPNESQNKLRSMTQLSQNLRTEKAHRDLLQRAVEAGFITRGEVAF